MTYLAPKWHDYELLWIRPLQVAKILCLHHLLTSAYFEEVVRTNDPRDLVILNLQYWEHLKAFLIIVASLSRKEDICKACIPNNISICKKVLIIKKILRKVLPQYVI